MNDRFKGLHSDKLKLRHAETMPEGARLLESEEERLAFLRIGGVHEDLWSPSELYGDWYKGHRGDDPTLIYATTRPRGWWKKTIDERFKGLHAEKLTTYAALNMPESTRLLESEEERLAFLKTGTWHEDLWLLSVSSSWVRVCKGGASYLIYATTRPRGWWKKPAKQEALGEIAKALRELALRLEEL